MEIEDQKFMALYGTQTWARAVLRQVERMEVANRAQDWPESMFRFQSERHLFLITAHKLVEHCEWVISLRYVDAALFDEILRLKPDIKR
jgi:hypothetical protein